MNNDAFRKGIREDGTVEGYAIETYYLPCKGVGDDEAGFLRVLIDDNATDVETRVPHSALISAGWVKATFPRGSWQHAVDDHLSAYGRTSQEFATPQEAVQWLLQITSDAAVASAATPE